MFTARARAVAVCYCPGRKGCDDAKDFVQRVGVLYFYLTRICKPNDLVCVGAVPGVLARFNFNVKVECPPGACLADASNRVRLIQQEAGNDLPSWDPQSGCRLKEEVSLRMPNCFNSTNCSLSGGVREDWKRFGEEEGFELHFGRAPYELRNNDMPMDVDVCYCNADCQSDANWFKAGSFKVSPLRLVSAKTASATLQEDWAVEYAHQPGVLGIRAPLENYGALGTSEGAVLRLVQDVGRQIREDSDCANTPSSMPEGLLVSGPSTSATARAGYRGYRQLPTIRNIDQEYYIFNSGDPEDPITGEITYNRIEAAEATTLAVCYCGFTLEDGRCESESAWKLVSHILIRGPHGGLQWEVSTEMEFDFTFAGVGLSTHQTMRIIHSSGSCTDDNGNPNTGRFELTGLRVKCPGACNDVGSADDVENGDISTVLLSGLELNMSITHIMVVSADETELHFEAEHGLVEGDVLTLDEDFDVQCLPDSPCSWATLEVLKGVFTYGDADINYRNRNTPIGQAPDTYMVGNIVTRVLDPFRIRIGIGWPEPEPMFWLGENTIGWTRRNKAAIAREVFGRTEQLGLRVCWGYATTYTERTFYVTELGSLNVLEPPAMSHTPRLYMTSTAVHSSAPMMLTFETSGGDVGLQYGAAREPLRLRIVFTSTDVLDIRRANGEELPDYHPDSGGMPEDATQAGCGDMLLELWSEDQQCGFPMPKGCYMRSYGYMQRREVYILFDNQNALRNQTRYSIVFNGQVRSTAAGLDGHYVYVDILDEMNTARRYKVIERGHAPLMASPQEPAKDPEAGGELDAQFAAGPGGFSLMGGENDLMQLRSSTEQLTFEMRGPFNESGNGRITRDSVLSIYLWPLMQWHTGETCTVECINTDHMCGPLMSLCEVQSLMGVGQNRNALRLQLPAEFEDLYGPNSSVQLRFGGLTMPESGFFGTRLAAQISGPDGRAPHYVVTGGTVIWKAPDSGSPMARLIDSLGNEQPFASDSGNVLYAQVLLPMTILAGPRWPSASFTITLPVGYTCVMPETLLTDGDDEDDNERGRPAINPWEAEIDLPYFASQEPQCRGTPVAAGSPTFGWSVEANRCTFTPDHPGGVVYHGSSMVIRITADNPPTAMPWTSPGNAWTLQMSGRGHSPTLLETQEYPFLLPDGQYSNVGVIGRLDHVSCQPSSFEPGAWQELSCFFSPQQEVQVGGLIEMLAPPGFNFSWEDLGIDNFGMDAGFGCLVRDLPDTFYAVNDDPTDATLRLPGVQSCLVQRDNPLNASIHVEQSLQAGRTYGFGIHVRNAVDYHQSQLRRWKLYTVDSGHNFLDATRYSIPFLPASGYLDSWALFRPNDFVASINISDLRPYALSGMRANVTVVLSNIRVPGADLYGGIRLVAPQGYQWTFTADEFLYRPPRDPTTSTTPAPDEDEADLDPDAHRLPPDLGATADFPFGLPRWDGGPALVFEHPARTTTTTTAFDPEANATNEEDDEEEEEPFDDNSSTIGEFYPDEVYAFRAFLTIPSNKPTMSVDVLYLEIGFNEEDASGRIGIIEYPMPTLKALSMAIVAYTSNIMNMDNRMNFRVATATQIAEGGGLVITAPIGFIFQDPCSMLPLDEAHQTPGHPAAVPPAECRTMVLSGRPTILLHAGPDGLAPAVYGFALEVMNPRNATENPIDGNTPCGVRHCWFFHSLASLEVMTLGNATVFQDVTDIDVSTSVRGFDITAAMEDAFILSIPLDQRVLIMRNDRRGVPNNVVFAFRLHEPATSGAYLLFRGPQGVEFSVNCMDGVEVHRDHILGGWENFPQGFAQWPGLVKVRSCAGNREEAIVGLVFLDNAELSAGNNYLVRMPLLLNPMVLPTPNTWTMELGREGQPGETSAPFDGFRLSTFADAAVFPSTPAAGPTDPDAVRPRNPVRVEFRVFNEIPPGGRMWLTLPVGYEVDAARAGGCLATLEELDGEAYSWPDEQIQCQVDRENIQDLVSLTLSAESERAMLAGQRHRVVIVVYNPALQDAAEDTRWHLETELPSGYPLDEGHLMGFDLSEEMPLWAYEPWEQNGVSLFHGAALIEGLTLSMRFPDPLRRNNQVRIEAPPLIRLEDEGTGLCRGFSWVTPAVLESATVSCHNSSMVIVIVNGINAGDLAQFRITVRNPTLRIPAIENVWVCTHFTAALLGLGSKAFDSWPIEPQLTDVAFRLLGPPFASGSIASIEVDFMPVAPAEYVILEAMQPLGFDFGTAVLRAIFGNGSPPEPVVVDGDHIGFNMMVTAGVLVRLQLDGVVLGTLGGQTSISISTWNGGSFQFGVWDPGEKQDEKTNFMEGFRLPARIHLAEQVLYTHHLRDPDMFPVQSMFYPHMGILAFAEFDLVISGDMARNDRLRIEGTPFNFTADGFNLSIAAADAVARNLTNAIEDCPWFFQERRCPVPATPTPLGHTLQVLLELPLIRNLPYKLTASVMTPHPPVVIELMEPKPWLFAIEDGGDLPKATNDLISTGFNLSEAYAVHVTPVQTRAPPGTVIEVDIDLEPGLQAPTELRVITPMGFSVPESCFVDGDGLVLSCIRVDPLPTGREVASLRTVRAGLRTKPDILRILVRTPDEEWSPTMDEEGRWFVQGLDFETRQQFGWGTTVGFTVNAMTDVMVTYSGAALVEGVIAWSFQTALETVNGSRLVVHLPVGLQARCDTGGFVALHLPGGTTCEEVSGTVSILLEESLPAGIYAFTFPVIPPSRTPFDNLLAIEVIDSLGHVQEAYRDVVGSSIHLLPIQALPLHWSASVPGNESNITVSFRVSELITLEQQAAGGIQDMGEVLITLPLGYSHSVAGRDDVDIHGPLPVLTTANGVVASDPGELRFRLRNVPLGVAYYEIRFPILVPEVNPVYNLWQVSMCGRSGDCSNSSASGVVLNMPTPGFAPHQIAPPRGGIAPSPSTTTPAPGEEVPHREANITGTMEMTVDSSVDACATSFLNLIRESLAASLRAITNDPSYVANEVKEISVDVCTRRRLQGFSQSGEIVVSYMVTALNESAADSLVTALTDDEHTFKNILEYDLWQRGDIMVWGIGVATPTVALPTTTTTTTVTTREGDTTTETTTTNVTSTVGTGTQATGTATTTTPSVMSSTNPTTTTTGDWIDLNRTDGDPVSSGGRRASAPVGFTSLIAAFILSSCRVGPVR